MSRAEKPRHSRNAQCFNQPAPQGRRGIDGLRRDTTLHNLPIRGFEQLSGDLDPFAVFRRLQVITLEKLSLAARQSASRVTVNQLVLRRPDLFKLLRVGEVFLLDGRLIIFRQIAEQIASHSLILFGSLPHFYTYRIKTDYGMG